MRQEQPYATHKAQWDFEEWFLVGLQSLLRCRWAEDCSFQLSYLLRVAHSTASALQYLHSLSICHGDVYAHNILPDADGNAVLCDYGEPVPKNASDVSKVMQSWAAAEFWSSYQDCDSAAGVSECSSHSRKWQQVKMQQLLC